MSDECREAFEKWWGAHPLIQHRDKAGLTLMVDSFQEIAWQSWQAARRSGSAGQWRLVPVEPTAEMASAGISVRNDKGKGIDSVWAAMLDAAPPPPGAGEG